jgi:hypothetical protein
MMALAGQDLAALRQAARQGIQAGKPGVRLIDLMIKRVESASGASDIPGRGDPVLREQYVVYSARRITWVSVNQIKKATTFITGLLITQLAWPRS